MLNRDSILKAKDLKTIELEVKEWGGTINLQTMTGHDRQEYYKTTAGKDGPKNVMGRLSSRAPLTMPESHCSHLQTLPNFPKNQPLPSAAFSKQRPS